MPFASIAAAKEAGVHTVLDDAPLTLAQINQMAKEADALRAEGKAGAPWAVVTANFKKRHIKKNGHWVNRETQMRKTQMEELPWVEIFRAGNYPQGNVSVEGLDEIVASYDPKVHEAPITLDHKQDGPALGWVQTVKRSGDLLLAQFGQVSQKLKDLIKNGEYKKRSVEIYNDFNGTGKPYLKAVTWLGAKIPQVKGLVDAVLAEDTHGPAMIAAFEEHEKEHEPNLQEEMDKNKLNEHWDQASRALHSEAWHIFQGASDTKVKKAALIRLINQMKTAISAEEFQEMPKEEEGKKTPEKAPEPPPPAVKTFTEDQVKSLLNDSHTQFETWRKEANDEIAGLKARNRAIELQAQAREIHAYCEDQKRQGCLLPAWQELGLEAFMVWLESHENGNGTMVFGEKKLSPAKWFREEFLSKMPKLMEFGEMKKGGNWEKVSQSAGRTLHEKTLAYAEKHQVSYADALEAVSREDSGATYEYMTEQGYHVER